jgi:hypothetical protein
MRVACIKDNIVINVIEVESLDKIPDVVAVIDDNVIVNKKEVKLILTENGSVGDLYIEGKGFYRFVGE